MPDSLGRSVNYLRLSVTDRCNLRCRYCMPAEGIDQVSCRDILSYESFLKIVRVSEALGIRKVRITGGEPLVRRGVIDFIAQVSRVPGIKEVTLTTNGLLLSGQVRALQNAGVLRLNISLDSLQENSYRELTRGGDLKQVLRGLEEAENSGMRIKLNMVVMRGLNDQEILDFAELSRRKPWSVRFIEYMPTIKEPRWQEKIVSGREILEKVQSVFSLEEIDRSPSCGPAKPYRITEAPGTLGIITPMSDHFCASCNRIRVTSTGFARSCLLSETATDLKPALKNADPRELEAILRQVISEKPEQHQLSDSSDETAPLYMAQIGG